MMTMVMLMMTKMTMGAMWMSLFALRGWRRG